MTYTTVQGDMFDGIAHRVMGDQRYKDLLMRENPGYLGTYILPAGVTLTVPEVSDRREADYLPPWRKING